MTRTKTLLVGIVALAGGAAVPAHATTMIQQASFSGTQAFFPFSASTSITCADGTTGVASAFGSVSGAQQISISTGSPQTISNGTFVEVDFYFNSCTNAFFSFGTGGIANSFTAPDKKLDSAAISGTGSVEDFNSPPDFLAVAVDVSFTGSGSTNSEKGTTHMKTTGSPHGNLSISHSSSASSSRGATVTGTITIDNVNFDAASAVSFADMNSNSSSQFSVSK